MSISKPIPQQQYYFDSTSSSLMDESFSSYKEGFNFYQFQSEYQSMNPNSTETQAIQIPKREENPMSMDSNFNFEAGSYDSNANSYCGSYTFQLEGFVF